MKRIAILQRSDNRIDPKAVYPLFDTLSSLGCEICLPKSVYPVYSGHTGTMCGIGDDLSGENIDFIFVLGGDGSIISAARKNAALKIPIVGINFGKLGYLAELEVSELGLIEKIISGKCDIEERIMLDVSVILGEEVLRTEYPALNDVVLSNGPVSKLLSFDLFANGVAAQSMRSDGIVISTPTGSTAYSMSAGGPVLDPCIRCIVGTPICPHTIGQRPVVFGCSAVLELRNMKCRGSNIYLTVDGNEVISLTENDTVRISLSEHSARLVRVKNSTFLKVLHEKMSEKS